MFSSELLSAKMFSAGGDVERGHVQTDKERKAEEITNLHEIKRQNQDFISVLFKLQNEILGM